MCFFLERPPKSLVTEVLATVSRRELDARFLVPILPGLSKSEVVSLLPKLLLLPRSILEAATSRLVTAFPGSTGSVFPPSEWMVALHQLEPQKEVPMTKIKEGFPRLLFFVIVAITFHCFQCRRFCPGGGKKCKKHVEYSSFECAYVDCLLVSS